MIFNIKMTWSKLMAAFLMGIAFYLDLTNGGIAATTYCTPFVVILITGKQALGLGQSAIERGKAADKA